MTTDLDRLADDLVRVCRRLAAAGLSPGGSGNVSARLGDQVLVTPTGSSLGRVRSEDLALLDVADGASRRGSVPSKEAPLHLAILRGNPAAAAVVHLHAAYSTAIACLPPDADGLAALPAFTPYRVLRLGDVPLVPYAPPGSPELAEGAARAAAAPVMLLAAHGPVVAAGTLDAAADLVEELENAAQVALLLAGSAAAPLPPDEIARLRGPSR